LIESGVLDRALDLGTGNRSLDAIAGALASPVINAAIDAAISPQSLALLMQGKSWAEARSANRARNTSGGSAEAPELDIEMNYRSLNEFTVMVKKPNSNAAPSQFALTRDGWFAWKLSSIKLGKR
jgi:hypothetical protein